MSWHYFKYFINATTTAINTCKKLFEFGQREVISFFTLVTNKGEQSIKQTLTGKEVKKNQTLKGARSLNC
jgi:hypothetical protein